jgi:iron-sulfur cluster assembly protein
MIELSDSAQTHINKLMIDAGLSSKTHYLRVGVKGGGCSGLSYTMDFVDKMESDDNWFEFDSGLKIIINQKSLLYVFGSELQYSDGLNGRGFQWVNPNASRTCGCGESFAL